MGIIVPEAVLPVGIKVSNVYMSFSGESITVLPRNMSGMYEVSSQYRVYNDSTRSTYSNIKFPISVPLYSMNQDGVSKNVYEILYSDLKLMYPGSQDVLETPAPSEPIADC